MLTSFFEKKKTSFLFYLLVTSYIYIIHTLTFLHKSTKHRWPAMNSPLVILETPRFRCSWSSQRVWEKSGRRFADGCDVWAVGAAKCVGTDQHSSTLTALDCSFMLINVDWCWLHYSASMCVNQHCENPSKCVGWSVVIPDVEPSNALNGQTAEWLLTDVHRRFRKSCIREKKDPIFLIHRSARPSVDG